MTPTLLYNINSNALVTGHSGDQYFAISHRWSMWDEESSSILKTGIINKSDGTRNINDMINVIKDKYIELVWIDTLCITSENKSREIRNMKDYYREAKAVFVVLDTCCGYYDLDSLDANIVKDRLPSIERMLQLHRDPNGTNTMTQEQKHVYHTLCHMFKADWFKRGWTLQEIIVAKKAYVWNGSSCIDIENIKSCMNYFDSVLPDITLESVEQDDDFELQRFVFSTKYEDISYGTIDMLMSERTCTLEEDYVYSILGLLNIDITIEYGIYLQDCQKRLFMELVKKNKAAEIFGHTYNGKNMFPIGCSYGDLIPDQPRYDSASYDLCDEGIKFYSPRIYGFDVIGTFELDLFDQEYPDENINIISNTLETDDMDDFIKAMFSITSADLDEQLRNRDEFLSSQYYSLLLHHIVTSSKAKYISYGMVHNNSMVCCYVFISTDTIFDQCLLVAPGLIGSTYETGLLCEQTDDGMMNRLGSTINMAKGTIDTIDCISQPESIIIRF